MAICMEHSMKLLGYALISAALLAAASTGPAAADRRVAGPYYIAYPYPYWTHRWGPWYRPYEHARFWGWRGGCCRRW
jgi:hypothetical protein